MLVCALAVGLLSLQLSPSGSTPLDDYVNKPDDTYRFVDLGGSVRGPNYTTYFLNLTSQTWLSPADVDRSVWWHYLVINVPDNVEYSDTGFVYITGGSNEDGLPSVTGQDIVLTRTICLGTGTVTAALFQVPNQHMIFTSDPLKKRRTEDAVIAFTWYHYTQIDSNNPEWLLRLPMTKAVVRAMDTVTEFVSSLNKSHQISKFVVAGASKRGWTTWTTGAVDKRVIGIAPIVMDLLNIHDNMHHHWRSLGGWTFAFNDYIDLNITGDVDEPNTQKMFGIIDPLVYADRLTMPKFVVTTGGDEFFLPDDSYYFWDQLEGEKFIRTIPNAEHSCFGHAVSLMLSAEAFYLSILTNTPRPQLSWTLSRSPDGGSITFKTDTTPLKVLLWHATTLDGKRRDFRLLTGPDPSNPTPHPVVWLSKELQPEEPGLYIGNMSVPLEGWRAFMIEATIQGPKGSTYIFTTQVNIIPDTFPFPDCHGQGCLGTLV